MNKREAEKAIKENGSIRAAAMALGVAESTFRDRMKAKGVINATPRSTPVRRTDSGKSQPVLSGGFTLGDARVSDRRPSDNMKSKIWKLKRGMAYPIDELSRQWAANPDTIRKHAKDVGAFLYVETSPEEWTPCVLHPDTAKDHV